MHAKYYIYTCIPHTSFKFQPKKQFTQFINHQHSTYHSIHSIQNFPLIHTSFNIYIIVIHIFSNIHQYLQLPTCIFWWSIYFINLIYVSWNWLKSFVFIGLFCFCFEHIFIYVCEPEHGFFGCSAFSMSIKGFKKKLNIVQWNIIELALTLNALHFT